MMSRTNLMLLTAAVTLLIAACGPPAPIHSVQRINPNAGVDLSGEWNDTDANQVAKAMIQDCLSRPWSATFKGEKGRLPMVRIHPIKNRSSEHINWRYFSKQVEMELINSGMVKIVSSMTEAQDNRNERTDQARHASDKTVKSQGQETGSDFVLNGWILIQHDALDGQEVRAYITTMELSNSESNEKVWMKVHKIKKVVTQAATQW
jgi:PBP1b-binding outer membrane lipoprotein LpoB